MKKNKSLFRAVAFALLLFNTASSLSSQAFAEGGSAAALFPEPREAVKVNGITFGVADIKALLSEAAMEVDADYYGTRVDYSSDHSTPKFDDVVPNEYFLVLTNHMGKLKQPIVIDRDTGDQVWTQPVAGYRIATPKPEDYLGAHPETPGIYRINLSTKIWWVQDSVPPDVITPEFNFQEDTDWVFGNRTLKMELCWMVRWFLMQMEKSFQVAI